jgi:hypothetical protein
MKFSKYVNPFESCLELEGAIFLLLLLNLIFILCKAIVQEIMGKPLVDSEVQN